MLPLGFIVFSHFSLNKKSLSSSLPYSLPASERSKLQDCFVRVYLQILRQVNLKTMLLFDCVAVRTNSLFFHETV